MSVGVRCFRRVLVQILGIDPIKITSSSNPWGCHLYQGTQAVSLKFQVPRPSRRPHELIWLPTLLVIDELIMRHREHRELKCQLRTSSCSIVRFYPAGGRRVPLRKQQGNSPQTQDRGASHAPRPYQGPPFLSVAEDELHSQLSE